VFGPTLTCLLAIQFSNLRNSDRFWYENDLPPSSFKLEQLQAIRRVSLSGLLCEARGVGTAQPKAFIREDPYLNAKLSCDQLSGLDLAPWKAESNEEVDEIPEEESEVYSIFEEVNPSLMQQAISNAMAKLNERKSLEYQSWLERRFSKCFLLGNLDLRPFIFAGGGISAKTPDGTAASFSKANRNALKIANSSLFYELTSNEIVQSIHK
jgi:hypothetical protein